MGHAINDQSHFAFENVNDLFLRMRMLWHTTPRRQRGKHLIHRLAIGNRPASNAGTNFNRRIFWFHLQKSYARHLLGAHFFIRNQRFTLATVPNRSESGNQESRKGISELKGKAARAASKERWQPLFQLRKNSLCKSAVICGQQISRRGRMRTMKTFTSFITILFATLIAIPSFAQTPATSPATASGASAAQPANATGQPNPQEMMKQMMELSKLNENH